MLDMRRVFYAVAAACAFTFVPLAILRLESTTKLVQLLKDIVAALGVPGAALGFILAGGRIHDIDSGVSDAANFAFYFAAMFVKSHQRRQEAPPQPKKSSCRPLTGVKSR